MKYGEITVKAYPSNMLVWYGVGEDSTWITIFCDGDIKVKCGRYSYDSGTALARGFSKLNRTGKINFIKKYK